MADKQLQFEATVSAAALNKLLGDLQNGAEGAAKAINDALGGTVTKKLLLETVTDVSGARTLVAVEKERLSVADQINNKIKQLDKTQRGSVTSLRQQVNEARQLRDGMIRYADSIGGIGGQLKTVNPLWAAQNARVAELQRQLDLAAASGFWSQIKTGLNLQGAANFLNGLTQITQGLQSASIVIGQVVGSVNDLINTAADLQSFGLSFKAIGVGAAGAQDALQDSARIALGLGTNIKTVQEGFRQLSPVVLNSGGNLDNVSAIVESLSSRFAAFGISGDKARRVTNGVIQAFAKGKLQAEELTQQISEADPAFKTDFARAVGVSVQELEKLVKSGQITTDVLIKALPQIGKSALLFGKLGNSAVSAADSLSEGNVTIDQVRNNLDTLNTLSFRNLATAFDPAIQGLIKIQAVLVDFLSRLSQFSALDSIGNILGNIAQSGSRVLNVFLGLAETVLRVLNVLAPLVDVLTRIPGVIELVGAALLSKFIKPLGLLEKAAKSAAAAQATFATKIKSFFTQEDPLKGVRQSVVDLRASLEKPVSSKLGSTIGADAKQIEQSGNAASQSIEKTSVKGVKAVDKQIAKTTQKIQELKASLAELGSAPTFQAPSSQAAVDEFAGLNWEIQTAIKNYDRAAQKADVFGNKLEEIQNRTTGALLRQLNIGENVRIVSPETLEGLRQLSSLDPAKAAGLLRGAIAGTSEELKKVSKGTEAYKQINSSLIQLRGALAEAKDFAKDGNAELRKNAALQKTAAAAAAEQAEASKQALAAYNQGLSEYNAKQQVFIDGIKQARTELKNLAKQRSALTGGGETGSVASGYKEEETALQRIEKVAADRIAKDEAANNKRLQFVESEKAKTLAALDAIDKKRKSLEAQQKTFRLPVGGLVEDTADIKKADELRARLERLNQVQGKLLANNRKSAASIGDLAAALDGATDAGSSYEQRSKSIGKATQIFSLAIGNAEKNIGGLTAKLEEIKKKRDALLRQQGARPLFPPVDPGTDSLLKQINKLGEEIKGLQTEISGFEQVRETALSGLDSLDEVFQANEKSAKKFGGVVGGLQAGFGRLVGGLGAIKNGVIAFGASIASAIGPLGFILLAVGAAQGAYARATEEANRVTEESKQRIDALIKAQEELTGLPAPLQTEEIKGLALLYERLGIAVRSVIGPVKDFFDSFSSKIGGAVGDSGIAELVGQLGRLAAAAGAGALAGAAIGTAFAGLGAGPGAVIGGITGVILALAASGDDAGVQLDKLQQKLDALGVAAESEKTKLIGFINELEKLAKVEVPSASPESPDPKAGPDNTAKIAGGYTEALNSFRALERQIKAVRAEADLTRQQLKDLGIDREIAVEATRLKKRIQELKIEANKPITDYSSKGVQQRAREAEELKRSEERLKEIIAQTGNEFGVPPEKLAEYQELENRLFKLESSYKELSPTLEAARKRINEFAAQFGFLTVEQQETARTIENVSAEVKFLEDALATVDPRQQAAKWVELNNKLAETKLELKAIQDNAELFQSLATAKAIKIAIDKGELFLSIENINTRLQALEKASVLIDVRSPTLPVILEQIVQTQDQLDLLDGYKASIIVEIIQRGIESGTITNSLSNIGRQVQALEQYKAIVPIDGSQIDEVATKLENVQRVQELGALSNDQLRERSFQSQSEQLQLLEGLEQKRADLANRVIKKEIDAKEAAIQQEKQGLTSALEAFKFASDQRIRALAEEGKKIDENIRKIQQEANARVSNLQKLTPAEQKLQALRAADLRKQVYSGGTPEERLQAKAQLERMDREAEIARIQAKAAKEVAAAEERKLQLEKQKEAEQEKQRQKEEETKKRLAELDEQAKALKVAQAEIDLAAAEKKQEFQEKLYALEEKAAGIRLARLEAEQQIIDKLLADRQRALEAGDLEGAERVNQAIVGTTQGLSTNATNLANSAEKASDKLSETGAPAAGEIAKQLTTAAEQADALAKRIEGLDGLTVRVNITGVPGLAVGGPTEAGKTYQVNEVGQEGFLSAGGTLSPIRRPKNALWRAPSSGTVIPAHIWSEINAPKASVGARIAGPGAESYSSGMAVLAKAINRSSPAKQSARSELTQLAQIQSEQAYQIGKLTNAVRSIHDKEWKVDLNINGNNPLLNKLRRRQ